MSTNDDAIYKGVALEYIPIGALICVQLSSVNGLGLNDISLFRHLAGFPANGVALHDANKGDVVEWTRKVLPPGKEPFYLK